jgi:hypothetical protein
MAGFSETEVEIQLEAADCTYKIGDTVKGSIVVTVHAIDAPLAHNGITLEAVVGAYTYPSTYQLNLSHSHVSSL